MSNEHRLTRITSWLRRNASTRTWFRMLDFNSLANFALFDCFWLKIRNVSSGGAARRRKRKEKKVQDKTTIYWCRFVWRSSFSFHSIFKWNVNDNVHLNNKTLEINAHYSPERKTEEKRSKGINWNNDCCFAFESKSFLWLRHNGSKNEQMKKERKHLLRRDDIVDIGDLGSSAISSSRKKKRNGKHS